MRVGPALEPTDYARAMERTIQGLRAAGLLTMTQMPQAAGGAGQEKAVNLQADEAVSGVRDR